MTMLNPSQDRIASSFAGISLNAWRFLVIAAVAALVLIGLPFLLSGFQTSVLAKVIFWSIAALGLNILVGYNGQFSLGHSAFFAIGAYTMAILLSKTGIPYWAIVPMAGALCLVAGFLFGLPALRLEGHYLALATFALAVATPQLLKVDAFESWTGGVQGINDLDQPAAPFGLAFLTPDRWAYFFCLLWAVPLFAIAWNLLRGRTGRAIVAIRDNPIAAASMGINVSIYKSLTFGVSAMYTGIAGALSVVVTPFVSPDTFDFLISVSLLVAIVVGGVATLPGAILGAFFIQYVPTYADRISHAIPWAVYGVAIIAVVYFMPGGMVGFLRWFWLSVRRRLMPTRLVSTGRPG